MTSFSRDFLLCILLFISFQSAYARETLIEHSSRPLQAESSLEALTPWETPISGFFIRSHFGPPVVEESKWVLKIDGLVDHPLTLTLADLKRMRHKTLHAVLECSGNGRAQQKPQAPGVQWKKGAVGNAEWGGIPLSAILEKVRVKPTARFATLEGADSPPLPGVPKFIRSVAVSKLMQADTLLALTMNREPLPLLHGGPIRLVLPGWYGENWTKWVTHITLTDQEDPGFFMKKGYRVPKTPLKAGETWDPTTGIPIEQILVQSLITSPLENQSVTAGEAVELKGKAFSGAGVISKVETSLDQGKTWQSAELEAPHASGGWQEFSQKVTFPKEGKWKLLSRATDNQGQTQPLTHSWNPGGYVRNSVDSVSVQVVSKVSSRVTQKCLICHAQELIESQRLSPKQWEGVLKKMEGFGVKLEPNEKTEILQELQKYAPDLDPKTTRAVSYLAEAERFKMRTLNGNSKNGAQLYSKFCFMCHGQNGEGQIGPRLKGRAIPHSEFFGTVSLGKRTMPPFKAVLKEKDISDLESFLQIPVNH